MSKFKQASFNKMDYSYETDVIVAISEFYHKIFGSDDIQTLLPVAGNICAYSGDQDLLYTLILGMADNSIRKAGFCRVNEGGGHWTAVVFSRENGNSTIICNILNSTTFGKRLEEEENAQDIFNSLQKEGVGFEEYLKQYGYNGITIRLEATKIPVYKQTGSVGCGAVALENLRRALYDNQDDTDTEQYMEDLDIRNYHELLYPPLANLNLDSTGQFLRISHRNTEWIKTDYWDNIGPTITDGVQKILRSVCNTQKHLDTNLQNSYNAKLPRGCSDDNNDVLEVLRISAKEFQASKVDTKKASNTQLPSKVNSKITDISGIIKAADLVDPVVCALNDDAILRDLLLEQPGLSFLSDLTPTEKQELLSEMQSTEAAPNISKKEPLASKTATKETNTLDCDTQITLIEIGEWLINNNQQYTAMSELDETYHWRDLPGCVTGSHPLATQLLGNNFEAQDFLLQYLTDGQTY